jgi:outer membrane protein insertion porin family
MFHKKKILLTFLIILMGVAAQANDIILDIEVTGNYNIDSNLILSLLPFDIGEYITLDKSSQAIKNLYQLGVFETVELELIELHSGVTVQLIVQEYPIVEGVKLKGNKKLKDSKLSDVSSLQVGSYWAPFSAFEVSSKIKQEYQLKGYHMVDIEFTIQETGINRVEVIIDIDEGSKVAVKKIRVHGNREVPNSKILRTMKTKRRSLLRSGRFEDDKFSEDLTRIIEFYNKQGYIDARILSHEVSLDESDFVIDVYLFEGISYNFGKVIPEGNSTFTDEQIISQFKFKENEVFNLTKYEDFKRNVHSMYYEEGYIYSYIQEDLEKANKEINIRLKIEENNRAKVRKIHLTGNRKTKERVMRRHLVISPGEYFRQSRVVKTQQNIYNMGFFEPDISLDYQPINNDGDIDLTINVNDKPAGSANGGVALNSQDGLVGQLSLSHNNLFGNSWQSGFKWEFGGKTQNFEFSFTNPYYRDTSTLVGFNIFHTDRKWDTYTIRTNGGSIRGGRPVGFLNYGRIVAGYSFYRKKYKLAGSTEEENVSATLENLVNRGWQNTSSLSLTFSRDSRDNYIFPTSGSNFTFFSEVAGGLLGGDFNYYKQIGQVNLNSGRSAVRLAHWFWEPGVGGSNPLAPTII